MLKINDLSLRIKNRTLLESISFEMNKDDFVVLLGGNGAGKSTLLKTISRSLEDYSGSIVLKEKPLEKWTQLSLAQNRAVLSQNIVLVFPMKVIDLVLLGRYPFTNGGPATTKDVAIAYEVLDLMGVVQYAERDVLELSGGEQQRVQIARVLAQVWNSSPENPKLLLLDEPTSNLDISYQHILLNILRKRVKENGLVVLAILHDINLAAQYASQIALLKKGKLIQFGEPTKSLTPEWINATFGVKAIVQNHPVFNCLQISTY